MLQWLENAAAPFVQSLVRMVAQLGRSNTDTYIQIINRYIDKAKNLGHLNNYEGKYRKFEHQGRTTRMA
jgi:hypothetical protein